MRVFIETAFSGILRGELLSVSTFSISDSSVAHAAVMITSRGNRDYPRGKVLTFPLYQVTPTDCFRVARQRGSGRLYLRCTQTHSRAELFAPYREGAKA